MRRVIRGEDPPPDALTRLDSSQLSELDRAISFYEAATPEKGSFAFSVYKADEVKRRLEKLFHGKCAYCETFYASSGPMDVEHYRPKGRIAGEAGHPGYWWLAMVWDNLLPSCLDCNRRRKQEVPRSTSLLALHEESRTFSGSSIMLTGKGDSFPIAETGVRAGDRNADLDGEQALLLNPCKDKPEDHLSFYIEREHLISLVLPKPVREGVPTDLPAVGEGGPAIVAEAAARRNVSIRGAVSIQVYGLNRLSLVQARTRVLRRLEFLETLVVELGSMADALEFPDGDDVLTDSERDRSIARRLRHLQDRTLAEIRAMAEPGAEYSTLVRAWVRQFRDSGELR